MLQNFWHFVFVHRPMLKLVFLSFWCSVLLSVSAGCKKEGMPLPAAMQPDGPVQDSAALTYLALGDSYTIGQGVSATERFPYFVAAGLRQRGIPVAEPTYIATTGWTTLNLKAAIERQNPPANFDLVTLLIGVNDQYQFRDTTGYRERFTGLLKKAISLAGGRKGRVFVLSIPDYSATPFVPAGSKSEVSREIDLFNSINREVTEANSVVYINITPLTREAASDKTLLAPDGLHYSAKAHQMWAELLLPLVKKAVE